MAKIRNGFVSNSSSSSFIINADKYDEDRIRNFIQALIDAHNIMRDESKGELRMEDVCEIYTSASIKAFAERIVDCDWYNLKGLEKNKRIEQIVEELKPDFPNDVVIIDSVGENSIPYSMQEELGEFGNWLS